MHRGKKKGEDHLLDATCFAFQLQALMSKITQGFDGRANIIDLVFFVFPRCLVLHSG